MIPDWLYRCMRRSDRIDGVPRWPVLVCSTHCQASGRLPWWYLRATTFWYLDADVMAWPGLHLVVRAVSWWTRARWTLERIGHRHGFYACEPGYYLSTGRWTIRREARA